MGRDKLRIAVVVGMVLLLGILARPLHAEITVDLFDDFGPGDSFNTSVGWAVTGTSTTHGYRAQAQRFTPSLDCTLQSVALALGKSSGSGLSTVTIVQDNGGYPTGEVLETFSNVATTGSFGGSYAPRVLNSVAQPSLITGITYWVRVEPADSTSALAWNNNNQGIADRFGYSFTPGVWDALEGSVPASGVMRVVASAVPEPAGMALAGAAAGGLSMRLRPTRRRAG